LAVKIDPVFLAGDLAGREIVDILDAAGQIGLLRVGQAAALAQGGGDIAIAVFLDEAHQLGAVELVGVHTLERLGAAPLPMLDQSRKSCEAQPTLPSRNAKRNSGRRPYVPAPAEQQRGPPLRLDDSQDPPSHSTSATHEPMTQCPVQSGLSNQSLK
jgi:hypothetical protein